VTAAANETQDEDDDDDGMADGADNCALAASDTQGDLDGDGKGDACDDSDGDGVLDDRDACPATPAPGGGCPSASASPPSSPIPIRTAAQLGLRLPASLTTRGFTRGLTVRVLSTQDVALRVAVVVPGRAKGLILDETNLPRSGRTHTVKLRAPRGSLSGVRVVEVRIIAINGGGLTTTATRKIRVRHLERRGHG
jgi:hypothetical protein